MANFLYAFFSSFSLAPGGTPRMSYSFVSTTFAMATGRAALGQEGGGADGAHLSGVGCSAGRGDNEREAGAELNFDPSHGAP